MFSESYVILIFMCESAVFRIRSGKDMNSKYV